MIEIFLTQFPVTKYEITKSSNDIVKAISAAARIDGEICGRMTFVKAWNGVAPKSKAASVKLGSRVLSLGITAKITYGILNVMCASNIVKYPSLKRITTNNNISPIAVTISGLRIGKSLIVKTTSRKIFLDFDKPIALNVPTMVEIMVESVAIETDVQTDAMTSRLLNNCSYHWKENPSKWVNERDELNENTIMIIIGK